MGELRRPHVLAFGEELGIPPRLAGRLLDELLRAIGPAVHETNASLPREVLLDAGALRQLRLIEHGVLSQMRRQLE